MADWSDLPSLLLGAIATKLDLKPDHLFFSAVCSSWRSIGMETRPRVCHQLCPRLVIPGEIKESQTRNCVDPIAGGDGYITYSHNKIRAKQLPVPHQSYVCGSSLGWLVLIDDNFNMKLFNPGSTQEFDLPSSKTLPPADARYTRFCKFYVDRAIISVDPTCSTPPQTTVLIIYSGDMHRLAFCRLGDEKWTPIVTKTRVWYDNVLYYKDKFIAVRSPGYCDIVDIDNETVIQYVVKPESEIYSWPRYLVECKDQLFLIVRIIHHNAELENDSDGGTDNYGNPPKDDGDIDSDGDCEGDGDARNVTDDGGSYGNSSKDDSDIDGDGDGDESENNGDGDEPENYGEHQCNHENLIYVSSEDRSDVLRHNKTTEFIIYKLEEESEERRNWIEVDNIGDNAFFVGYNSPFSLSATDNLGCKTCKPNSIYFTDDDKPLEFISSPIVHNIGVFSIDSGKIESVFPAETDVMRPPPFWFYQK